MADSNTNPPMFVNDVMSDPKAPPATTPTGMINSAPAITTATPAQAAGGPAPVASYDPSQAKATTYAPDAFTVAPNQTVAGQLKDIIASGSPLMQQAEAQARAQMNARGLINSSTAISAGQSAVIGAAMPIATADAATNERAATNTTGAINTARGTNAATETQTGQFNTGQTNASLSQAATASNQMSLTELQGRNAQDLQKLVTSGALAQIDAQGTIQKTLMDMSNKNKLMLQTSQGASSYYNTMLQYMASITSSPNLDAGQKTQAMNNAVVQLNDALDAMTSIAELPGVQSTLNFGDFRVPDALPYVPPPAKSGGGLFG